MRRFNLSLDDMSPHKRAGIGFESIYWCDRLIEKYPDIKINLFVPAGYCRLGENPNYLSDNLEWVERVNNLARENYRINFHGLYHRRTGDPKHHNSNNDEFQFLNKPQAEKIISRIIKEFDTAGLRYEKTFRAPGWKMSESVAGVLAERGFIIAGNDQYYNIISKKFKNIKWVNYNWDLTGPCNIDGDIVAYGHTSDWTNNYMNKERFVLIDDVLQQDDFDYVFIEQLV
jgi:predicted deacetylase